MVRTCVAYACLGKHNQREVIRRHFSSPEVFFAAPTKAELITEPGTYMWLPGQERTLLEGSGAAIPSTEMKPYLLWFHVVKVSVQMNKPRNARAFALYMFVLSRTLLQVQHTAGVVQPRSCNNRTYMFKFCTNNSIPLICQNTTKYSEVEIVFLENSLPDGSYNNSFCYERIIRWGICF